MLRTVISSTIGIMLFTTASHAVVTQHDMKIIDQQPAKSASGTRACPDGAHVIEHLTTKAQLPLEHHVISISNRGAAYKGLQNQRNIKVTWEADSIILKLKDGRKIGDIDSLTLVQRENHCTNTGSDGWRCSCTYTAKDKSDIQIGGVQLDGGKREILSAASKLLTQKK